MGTPRPLVPILLVALLLAGCAEPLRGFVYEPVEAPPITLAALTEAVEPVRYELDHSSLRIPSFDGIELAADVWVPRTNGTVPTILILSPYFEAAKIEAVENLPLPGTLYSEVLGRFGPAGYAVALVDLRGTRQSDGCLDLGGPNEQGDAYAVVEWLAAQEWSNGKVGMMGLSYDGWTAQMAAASRAPHLAAIVPIAPVADWYHVVGKGGAKYAKWTPDAAFAYNFGFGMGVELPPAPPEPGAPPPDPDDPRVARADDQSCAVVNQAWSHDPTGSYNAWMKERDLRPLAAGATAPMLYTHGLVDQQARPDHVDPWYASYGGPKRAWLWQAAHVVPNGFNSGRGVADQGEWWGLATQWLDHHLLGVENGVNATYGVVEVQDSLGRWRNETTWPPANVTVAEWALGPGTLGPAAAGAATPLSALLAPAAATATWQDDPSEDGGALGGKSTLPARPSPGRLAFVSAPLAEDVHFAGRPVVRALLESDRPNTLIVARLYEVLQDGSWILLDRGVQSLAHRDGLDAPAPGSPATPYEVHVAMQPMDLVIRANRSIGLVLSSSDASYVIPSGTMATNTIHFDAGASALLLPLVPNVGYTRVTWGPQQPGWLGPYAWEEAP